MHSPTTSAISCGRWHAGADQGLLADDLEGQADQDRREGGEPRPLCYLPDGRGRHRTANVPRDFAASRNCGRSHHQRQHEMFDSHAFKSNRRNECVRMPRKTARSGSQIPLGRSGMSEPSTLSHLGFQPVQKTPTIHVSSGFIWGIPVMKTKGRARGARRIEGTGITDLTGC